MTDAPKAQAAALDETFPVGEPAEAGLSVIEDPPPDPLETDRPRRIADIVVAVSFFLKVAWYLVVSRGWFYTGDDWDYLTRTGLGEVFAPHNGHLTAVVSGFAQLVRGAFGYDYWPAYAILPAFSVPLVGAAAYYVWRRRRVNPVVAASGAVFLMWMGAAAWIQYGHSGMGYALAATIVAIDVDERRLSAGSVSAGLALTVAAALASTIGAIGIIGRFLASLVRRKPTGLATTTPIIIWYLWYRSLNGSPGELLLGVGDLLTSFGVAFQLVGDGMLLIVPWSSEVAWVLGLVLIGIAAAALVVSRFSYATIAIIAMGAGYVLSVVMYRYLGRPDKLEALQANGLNLVTVTSPRYAQIVMTVVIVAVVPLIAAWFRSDRRRYALIAVVAVLVGIGAYHTVQRFDRIAFKSEPVASRVAGYLTLLGDGEPAVVDGRQIDPRVGKALTFESMQWMVDEGLHTSLLASDIYDVAGLEPPDPEFTRGRMRMNLWSKGKITGTWDDVGIDSGRKCRELTKTTSFEVTAPLLYSLELNNRNTVVLRWEDEFGAGIVIIGEDEFTWEEKAGTIFVKTAAPSADAPPPIMTIQAGNEGRKINATMCLKKSPSDA